MQTAKDILLKILENIDYQEDKNKFVESFLKNTAGQTFIDLVKTLPEDKQKSITLKDGQAPFEVLNNYFSQEQIQEAQKNASSNAIKKFLEEVYPTLSEIQRGRLENLFDEIKQANPQLVTNSPQ